MNALPTPSDDIRPHPLFVKVAATLVRQPAFMLGLLFRLGVRRPFYWEPRGYKEEYSALLRSTWWPFPLDAFLTLPL